MVFSFQAWINNSICIDQSTEPDEDGLGSTRNARVRPEKKNPNPPRLLSQRGSLQSGGPRQGPTDVPRWGKRSQQHLRGVDAIVSARMRNTENRRIPRTRHALFMCYEKHDSKGSRKQLCSTFTVSHHAKCEEDESETQTGRREQRRVIFFIHR